MANHYDEGNQEAEDENALQESLYTLEEEEARNLQELLDALQEAQKADRHAILEAIFEETYEAGDVHAKEALFVLPALLHFLSTTSQLDEQREVLYHVACLIQEAKENREASPRATLGVPAITRLYQVLCEWVPLYAAFLSSDDPANRALAAFLLGYSTSSTIDLIALLKTHFAAEHEENVQFAFVKAITLLNGYTSEELDKLFASTNSFSVKHAVAVALTKVLGDGITPAVEEILVQSLLDEERIEKALRLAPYDASARYAVLDVLAFLSPQRCVAVLLRALEQWSSSISRDERTLLELIEVLFERVHLSHQAVEIQFTPTSHGTYELGYAVRWQEHSQQSARQELSEKQYQVLRHLLIKDKQIRQLMRPSKVYDPRATARDVLREVLQIR